MIFFSETTLWIDIDFLCINFMWNMESPSLVVFRSFFFFLLLWKAASLYVPPSSSLSFFPLFFFNPQWHTPTFPLSQSQSSWWCSSLYMSVAPSRLGAPPNTLTELFIFLKSPSPQSVSYHKCLMRDFWMREEKKMKGQRILRVRIDFYWCPVVLTSKGSQKSCPSSLQCLESLRLCQVSFMPPSGVFTIGWSGWDTVLPMQGA